jgi:hypothetical protein
MSSAGYQNAPATTMLATHCAACGRPLLDAESVETGMGPDCRKRLGYNRPEGCVDRGAAQRLLGPDGLRLSEDGDDPHQDANRLVREIALEQTGERAARMAAALWYLGYAKVAARVARRLGVEVSEEQGDLVVRAPFHPEAGRTLRTCAPGTSFDARAKAWRAPASTRAGVLAALRRLYAGRVLVGTKGATVLAA